MKKYTKDQIAILKLLSIESLGHRQRETILALAEHSVQFSSVTQSCLTLRDLMDWSTLGLPIHHQLPEFTQTHVH